MRVSNVWLLALLSTTVLSVYAASAQAGASPSSITAEAINGAKLEAIPVDYAPGSASVDPIKTASTKAGGEVDGPAEKLPSASIARLQILLDRAGASPGVIDGFDGENVRHAVAAFEEMQALGVDGKVGAQVIAALESPDQAIGTYAIAEEDEALIVPEVPKDYAKMAELPFIGFTSMAEALGERFHMDVDFLKSLNPGTAFKVGETIYVTDLGSSKKGQVAKIDVDKREGQVRAYGADGRLIVAYPATIGSEENPSPSGSHVVETIVENPTYTYNPKINFTQGDNDKVLTLQAGPNGPVGTIWIDLSEPTFGIHGTPEPSKIGKTGSHGCVRLTNWDAQELAKMVRKGVVVDFL